MKNTSINLPDDVYQWLKKTAESEVRPLTNLVNVILRQEMERRAAAARLGEA